MIYHHTVSDGTALLQICIAILELPKRACSDFCALRTIMDVWIIFLFQVYNPKAIIIPDDNSE